MEQSIEGNDALFGERVRLFQEFLDSNSPNSTDYKELIKHMLDKDERRLIVSLDDIRNWNKEFWNGILNDPADFLPACEKALVDTISSVFDISTIDDRAQFFIGFKGSFGSHQLSPKTIKSSFLSKMISIEGIVTKTSLIRPKLVKSVHFSEAKNQFYYREYNDQTTSFNPVVNSSVYPTEDPDGNKIVTEFGYSTYKDYQKVSIQEMPEKADPGQLPRSVEIVLNDDLVDKVKAGDRVQIVGIYRTLGTNNFKTIILANAIYSLHTASSSNLNIENITDMDLRNFTKIRKKANLLEKMSQSLAPSIYGHDLIKQAVLLMLLGGVEKNLSNGTHLRGDINVLMVGDPSTAKSQILRFVLNTASLAIATTGKGSSGVGLTAAVSTDKETGERKLEAGAMVLADRGIVCIDEFDKMSDIDRVAIHEVMEQQTVTIAKAGIHTSLNARCSVIAAANPVFGQYDVHKDPHQNIALPDSLLSRFDLLFVVTDDISDSRDRKISEHVLKIHRFLPKGYSEGEPIRQFQNMSLSTGEDDPQDIDENGTSEIYEKFNLLLHGGALEYFQKKKATVKEVKLFSLPFIRKYVQYAKEKKPKLSNGASNHIVEVYASLRNDAMNSNERKTAPITARTLETLIRLATAHAKLRLSNTVNKNDALEAERILRFALFKEVIKVRRKTKKRRVDEQPNENNEEEDDSDLEYDESDEDTNMDAVVENSAENLMQPDDFELLNADDSALQETSTNIVDQEQTISASRLSQFSKIIARLMKSSIFEDESCPIDSLFARVNENLNDEEKFSSTEFERALEEMNKKNQIMVAEGKVWIV